MSTLLRITLFLSTLILLIEGRSHHHHHHHHHHHKSPSTQPEEKPDSPTLPSRASRSLISNSRYDRDCFFSPLGCLIPKAGRVKVRSVSQVPKKTRSGLKDRLVRLVSSSDEVETQKKKNRKRNAEKHTVHQPPKPVDTVVDWSWFLDLLLRIFS